MSCPLNIFHQSRLNLNRKSKNTSRHGRGSMYASDYISMTVDKSSATHEEILPTIVEKYKQQFMNEFPQVEHIIANYKAVDQGEQGACSLVGFINLASLNGIDISSTRGNWTRLWDNRQAMEDIGAMLDTFSERLNFGSFHYIPINGTEEIYYNKVHWNPEQCQTHFGITMKEYNKAPFVFENGYLLETLLASNTPVEINALEHSRTAIAYNDEHILFADNWAPSAYLESTQKADMYGKVTTGIKGGQEIKCAPIELFAASFSRVNKWFIYSMMRDIVFFQNKTTRKELRVVAKRGELKKYGINSNSTDGDIKNALKKHNNKKK